MPGAFQNGRCVSIFHAMCTRCGVPPIRSVLGGVAYLVHSRWAVPSADHETLTWHSLGIAQDSSSRRAHWLRKSAMIPIMFRAAAYVNHNQRLGSPGLTQPAQNRNRMARQLDLVNNMVAALAARKRRRKHGNAMQPQSATNANSNCELINIQNNSEI